MPGRGWLSGWRRRRPCVVSVGSSGQRRPVASPVVPSWHRVCRGVLVRVLARPKIPKEILKQPLSSGSICPSLYRCGETAGCPKVDHVGQSMRGRQVVPAWLPVAAPIGSSRSDCGQSPRGASARMHAAGVFYREVIVRLQGRSVGCAVSDFSAAALGSMDVSSARQSVEQRHTRGTHLCQFSRAIAPKCQPIT